MEILFILLFCGVAIFFGYLYDKFIGDPLIFKNIKQHEKKENQEYTKLGINPKKETPYKIQEKIDHLKDKMGYTSQLIFKLNNKNEDEDLVKKANLKNQYNSYQKEFADLQDKGLLLVKNNLAEICNNCGTLRDIPRTWGAFGPKRDNSFGCYKCSMEIGYECSREKEIEILTNIINNYTGPIYSLELPKTHPRSPGYSYSKKNLREYMRLRMDFDLYIDNLRNKDI